MSNRLLIKSTICSYDHGVWEEEERDEEGNITKERRKIKDRPTINDSTTFEVDLPLKVVRVRNGNKVEAYPVTPYALTLKDRN